MIVTQAPQPWVQRERLPLGLVREQRVARDPGDDLALAQMNVGAVDVEVVDEIAQPYLQQFRPRLENRSRIFDEGRAIEPPVIFAMKDVRGFDMTVGQVDRRQLPKLGLVHEHRAVRLPVLRYGVVHGLVTAVFGDENLTDRRRVELIEAVQRQLEQIEPPAAGHYQRHITLFTKLHSNPR